MNAHEPISDEMLNAFIDGELDTKEHTSILARLEHDNNLADRLNKLRYLKELVFAARPTNNNTKTINLKLPVNRMVYSCSTAAMIITLIAGLFLWVTLITPHPTVLADVKINKIIKEHDDKQEVKVVIHFTKDEHMAINTLLDQAELLAGLNHKLGKPVRVKLIANGKGLTAFRQGHSAHQTRISTLLHKYDNLLFIACQKTMQTIYKNNNKRVSLLPGIVSIESGNDEVALRRKQGWSYLTI